MSSGWFFVMRETYDLVKSLFMNATLGMDCVKLRFKKRLSPTDDQIAFKPGRGNLGRGALH
jgi:hypothetical protein